MNCVRPSIDPIVTRPTPHNTQWRPALFEGNKPIESYLEKEDYNLNEDLADQNIRYIEQHAALNPNKPWMLYYAPGAFGAAGGGRFRVRGVNGPSGFVLVFHGMTF